jgi:two-component system chemotaxis sensor kinase CheA
METEQLIASLEEVDLCEFLENLKSDYAISFSNKNVDLRWEHATDLPLARLDRDKLRHILENLINNAIKFTEAGSIIVAARLVENSAQLSKTGTHSRWVELAVADTGVGMPAESLALIFEKFCQLDATSTRLHGGVGIGLYLVKRFATVLGGDVMVESQVGKGSTFTVTIPFIPAGVGAVQGSNAEDRQAKINSVSSRPEQLSGRRLSGAR